MGLPFEAEQADEQFLEDVLTLLDVEEDKAAPQHSPQPTLKRRRPRANSDTAVKPKRVRKDTTPRVRNKAKIEFLRHEIKGLEAVLASLQNSKGRADWHRTDSMWKIIAARQSYERERAEHRNLGLKRMLSQQCALARSLSNVLTQWDNLPAPDISFGTCM